MAPGTRALLERVAALTNTGVLPVADPPVPPSRVLYDPNHVIDHNTIREALLWLIAKADELPPSGGPPIWG